jgi:hypothetical protein
MQLLAGGEVACQNLPADAVAAWTSGKRNAIRAVFLAAAVDADWLAPGGRDGRALPLLDQVLVTCNECDRVLRWYPRMYGRGGPQAMGFVGPYCVDAADKLSVIDVSCTVGKLHDCHCYSTASNVCSQWAHYTFLDDVTPRP